MWLALACASPLVCGSGTHEDDGVCVADADSDIPAPVGNDVGLDTYPPVVIATTPVSGDGNVDGALDEIAVTFSRRMDTRRMAWVQANYAFPDSGDAEFIADDTCVLSDVVLETGQPYVVWINDPFGQFVGFFDREGAAAMAYPIAFASGGDADDLVELPGAVVSTSPLAGRAGVSTLTTRIEVTFSKDMDESVLAFVPDALETTPAIMDIGFSSPRTAYLDVTLAADTTYALWVGREDDVQFVDAEGWPVMPYLLSFRTGEAL